MEVIPDWIEEIDSPLANPAREKFAQSYVNTSNASEAYRTAYPASVNWKPKTVWSKASELKNSVEVVGRVKYLLKELEKETINAAIASREEVAGFFTAEMRNVEEFRKPLLNPMGLPVVVNGEAVYEDVPHTARIKAASELSKMMGYEAPKKLEVKNGGVTEDYMGPPGLAGLSTDELLAIAGENMPTGDNVKKANRLAKRKTKRAKHFTRRPWKMKAAKSAAKETHLDGEEE